MEIKSKCHCCLQRLSARDLRTPFTDLGITESYSDMMAECFAINLLLDINSECGICLECVNHLREACHFKLQVLQSQAKLREFWGREQQVIEEDTFDAMMSADDEFSSNQTQRGERRENIPGRINMIKETLTVMGNVKLMLDSELRQLEDQLKAKKHG